MRVSYLRKAVIAASEASEKLVRNCLALCGKGIYRVIGAENFHHIIGRDRFFEVCQVYRQRVH